MDNWLETLIGTVIIGGIVGVTAHQSRKAGYNDCKEDMTRTLQDAEIAKLREELNALKTKQLT